MCKKTVKSSVIFSVVLAIVFLSIPIASAYDETFNVTAGNNHLVYLGLYKGQSVSGFFAVEGGNKDIIFTVYNPSNQQVISFGQTQGTNFQFDAYYEGLYTIAFDNSFSAVTSKTITLQYTISSPTPTPSPTAQPTMVQTKQPTIAPTYYPTVVPTSHPTPVTPEFPALIILPLFAVVLLAVLVVKKRSSTNFYKNPT